MSQGGGSQRKYEKVVEGGRGPKVLKSKSPKVLGSQGSRYLKVSFKYKLDSKEGPSCIYFLSFISLLSFCFSVEYVLHI